MAKDSGLARFAPREMQMSQPEPFEIKAETNPGRMALVGIYSDGFHGVPREGLEQLLL